VRELNPEIGGLLRNISESATDKGLNRTKASSQSPDGGYVGGRRISGGMQDDYPDEVWNSPGWVEDEGWMQASGRRIAIWTKFGIAKDERRTKDNYPDKVQSSPG
jgi:hypothetical protein